MTCGEAIPPVAIQAIQELQHEKVTALSYRAAEVLQEAQSHVSDIASRFFWYEFTPYEIGCDEIGGELLALCLSVCHRG